MLKKRSGMCKSFWKDLKDTCGSEGPFVHFAKNYKTFIYEVDKSLSICWNYLGIATPYRSEYQEAWNNSSDLVNPACIKSYGKIVESFYFTLNDLRLKTSTTFTDEFKKQIQEDHFQRTVVSIENLLNFVNKHPIQLIFSSTKDTNYIPIINFLYAEKSDTDFISFDNFIYRLNHFYLGKPFPNYELCVCPNTTSR